MLKKNKKVISIALFVLTFLSLISIKLYINPTSSNHVPSPNPSPSIPAKETAIGILEIGVPAEKSILSSTSYSPPVTVQNISLLSKYIGVNFAAPSFVNDEYIFSEVDDSTTEGKQESYILQFNKKDQSERKIYTAPQKKFINSLIGLENQLFWIEFPRKRDQNLNLLWQIVCMDLPTKTTKVITEGVGQDQINPPVLRIYEDTITWITKEIKDGIVYSHLYFMKEDQVPKKLTTVTLNKTNKEQLEGIFLDIQRPVAEGMLVQEVVFAKKDATENSEKTSRISLYPYEGGDCKVMMVTKGYTDFTMNKDWFVLAQDGVVQVYSLSTGKPIYEIKQVIPTTTTDSPFIYKNTLFYRTSMYSISALNLDTGEHKVIANKGSITSKLFNSSNRLGFSYKSARDNQGYVEFTILEM